MNGNESVQGRVDLCGDDVKNPVGVHVRDASRPNGRILRAEFSGREIVMISLRELDRVALLRRDHSAQSICQEIRPAVLIEIRRSERTKLEALGRLPGAARVGGDHYK